MPSKSTVKRAFNWYHEYRKETWNINFSLEHPNRKNGTTSPVILY